MLYGRDLAARRDESWLAGCLDIIQPIQIYKGTAIAKNLVSFLFESAASTIPCTLYSFTRRHALMPIYGLFYKGTSFVGAPGAWPRNVLICVFRLITYDMKGS